MVAYNASFDIGVLRHTLDDYRIPYPELDYYYTRAISHALWTTLPSYGWSLFPTISAYRSRTTQSKRTQWRAPP